MRREDKALKDILQGKTPEKRIYISTMDKNDEVLIEERKKREQEQKLMSDKLDATKDARTPGFCPACKKVLKSKIDDKMGRLRGHCFDCQLKEEHKMRLNGTGKHYEKLKVTENKLSGIKEQISTIEDGKSLNKGEVKFYNQVNPDGHSVDEETWRGDNAKINEQAEEALAHFKQMEKDTKSEIENIRTLLAE